MFAPDFAKAQSASLPVKETSSTLLCVSSLDRYASIDDARSNPKSSGRFTINRPNASMLNGHFSSLALTELRMHWTFPNVSTRFGTGSIVLETSEGNTAENVQSYAIQLMEGFYSPGELAAALQVHIEAAVPTLGLTCTYDSRFNFSCDQTAGLYFRFMPDPKAFTNGVPYQVATPGMQGKQLFDMMNLTITQFAPGEAMYYHQIYSGVPSMRWTEYVDITCKQLTANQLMADSSTQSRVKTMLARVYLDESLSSSDMYVSGGMVNGTRQFVIQRLFNQPKRIRWNPQQPLAGNLQFEMYDDAGRCLADFQGFDTNFDMTGAYVPQAPADTEFNFTLLVSEE